MRDFSKLTEDQLDALREIGTIGAGHAASALSQMAERKIMISVPLVKAVPLKDLPELVGAPEKLMAALYMKLLGDARGRTLLLFPRESALNLVDILMKRSEGTTKFLSEMDRSVVKEAGNILTGSFLTALSDFLGILLMPSVPELAFDMIGSILESLAVEFGEETDYLFCIQNKFIDASSKVNGSFLLVFDRKSLILIIEKIELKIRDKWRRKER